MTGPVERTRNLVLFPNGHGQPVVRGNWSGKTQIADYSSFCQKLQEFFRRGEWGGELGFYHKVKVTNQGGFFLELGGEAVPVFSFGLMRGFAKKEVFVSAEIRNGHKILVISTDGRTPSIERFYNRELNRFYYRHRMDGAEQATYILAVGAENRASFLGHKMNFKFNWRPGDIFLVQVEDRVGITRVYSRNKNEDFPLARVSQDGRPDTLLLGEPATSAMLADVSGILGTKLSVLPYKKSQSYYFNLAGKEYYLTPEDFEGIPDPLKAKLAVTLDHGKVVAVEMKQGRIKRRVEFIVVRDEKGEVETVSSHKILYPPKGRTHIVEGFFSQIVPVESGVPSALFREEVDFFGARGTVRTMSAGLAAAARIHRYSFLVHDGVITDLRESDFSLPTRLNLLKLRAFILTEWQEKAACEGGFYRELLAQPAARSAAEERAWQIKFFSRLQGLLDGGSPSMLEEADYKQAAAFLFAIEYMLAGKSTLPAEAVEANIPKVLPLVASLGKEKLAQAAAWMWAFSETQQVLLRVLPCLDIRDSDFGPQIIGAFNLDPFLWDQVFQRLFGRERQ